MKRLKMSQLLKICHRSFFFLFLILGTLCIFLFYMSKYLDTNRTYVITKPPLIATSKVVLLWTAFYDTFSGHPLNSGCAEDSRCYFTHDRSLLRVSDVVVFHCRDINLLDLPPRPRNPDQIWIFLCLEPPPYSYFLGFRYMDHMFNWTMTYRRDSDVPCYYGTFRKRRSDEIYQQNITQWSFKNKTKMAYWLVSHCKTDGRRETFVENLMKYIDVTIIGKCGKMACPRSRANEECLQSLSKTYKFILALENSICVDYVTEKMFQSMTHDVIPVVFGGLNYSQFNPPHSVIDAFTFNNTKDLAYYLEDVAKNESLYRSYFAWKKDYVIDQHKCSCSLCSKLLTPSLQRSIYKDLRFWWVNEGDCRSWYP